MLVAHKGTLLLLVLLIYGPLYLANAAVVYAGIVEPDDADKFFGLLGVPLMPVINGCIVWLAQRWYDGDQAGLGQALGAVPKYWSRLLTVYISISFILLGWLIITVLPVYVLMMILKINQPLYLVPVAAVAGVTALCRFAFVDPLVVTQGLSPWHARRESLSLVRGRRWPVIGWGILTYALPFALESLGELAGELFPACERQLNIAIATGAGLVASLLYVVPVMFFYVYYRSVVSDGAVISHASLTGAQP